MKKLLFCLLGLIGASAYGAIGGGVGGLTITNQNTLQSGASFYVLHGSATTMGVGTLQFNDGSSMTTAATSGAGSSSLQIKVNGTQISSPTASLQFSSSFIGTNPSVGISSISLNPGTTLFIQNTANPLNSTQVFSVSSASVKGQFAVVSGVSQIYFAPTSTESIRIINTSSETAYVQYYGSGTARWRWGADPKILNVRDFGLYNAATSVYTIQISTGDLITLNGTVLISGLTASRPVKTDASKQLVSGLIDVTMDITGTVPSGNLPTNIDYTNIQQTISASKVFSSSQTFGTVAISTIIWADGTIQVSSPTAGGGGGGGSGVSVYPATATASFPFGTSVSTLTITSGTNRSILFYDSSGNVSQSNTNFSWDDSNHTLRLGSADSGTYENLRLRGNFTHRAAFSPSNMYTNWQNYSGGSVAYEGWAETSQRGATGNNDAFYISDGGNNNLFAVDTGAQRVHVGANGQTQNSNAGLNVYSNAAIGLSIAASSPIFPVNGLWVQGVIKSSGTGTFPFGVNLSTLTITSLTGQPCVGTDGSGNLIAGTCSGGGGGSSSLEVFSNFDAVRSSPTASIATGDALKLSVSGSTAIVTVDFSSVTALGPQIDLNSTAEVTGVLPVANGGTGANTLSLYGSLYGNGTSAIGVVTAGSAGLVLTSQLAGPPTWAAPTGGGGSSTLAVGTGTAANFTNNITSPTAAISFLGSQFQSTTVGTTNFITVNQSSLTVQGNTFNGANQLLQLNASSLVPNANIDSSSITKQGQGVAVLIATQTFSGQNTFISTGTLPAIKITANGTYGTTDGTSGGLLVDCTGGGGVSGECVQFYSNASTQAALGGIVNIIQASGGNTWNEPGLYIKMASTNGGAANARLDGPVPQIEWVENDQVSPAGKYEDGVNGDIRYIAGRKSDNSGFESFVELVRPGASGGGYINFVSSQTPVRFSDGAGTHYVAFRASATVASNSTYVWPATAGGANTVLQTDGSNNLFFAAVSSLSATGVTSGSYGSATQVPTFTVDAQGRLSAASNTTISLTNSNLQSGTYSNVTVPAANVAAGSLGSSVIASSIAAASVGIAQHSATGSPSASTFLRGDNTWATPAGSGDAVLASTQTWTGGNTFKSSSTFNGPVLDRSNSAGTLAQVLASSGPGLGVYWATASGGSSGFNYTFNAMQARSTDTATACAISGSTNSLVDTLLCDDTANEGMIWSTTLTPYNSGTLTAAIYFSMVSATSGNVVNDVYVACVADGASQDIDTKAFAAANSVTTAVPGTAGYLKVATVTLTNNDSCAAGNLLAIKVRRNGSSGSDTASGDQEIRKVRIYE